MNFYTEILKWLFVYLARHGYSIQTFIKEPRKHGKDLNFKRQLDSNLMKLGASHLLCRFFVKLIGMMHNHLANHGYTIKTYIQMPIACCNCLVFEKSKNISATYIYALDLGNLIKIG